MGGLAEAQESLSEPLRVRLGDAPVAPMFEEHVARPRRSLSAVPAGYRVDTQSREQVRSFYNTVYQAAENAESDWTGNYGACHPGTTQDAFKAQVILRVNYFRAMAGVPAGVALDLATSLKAQEAALMMSSQGDLDHFPATSWACYTAEGAEAARNSNLALGSHGPQSVNGYMEDHGGGNAAVGHRRWLLYPQTERMGTGDVPGDDSLMAANAIWVFDGRFGQERPSTREAYVAWPPPGYVPYSQVYTRWSFSHPGADFASASVTLTSNGVPVAVRLEPLVANTGESTLVWYPAGSNPGQPTPVTKPSADVEYGVEVRGVRVRGTATDFRYTVRAFDPATPGPDTVVPRIQGPSQVPVGVGTTYPFEPVPMAEGYEWRQASRETGLLLEGAEGNAGGLVADTSAGYDVVVRSPVASGSFAYHLAHPAPPKDQILVHRKVFLLAADSELRFRSRLGLATSIQRATVQISDDEGRTWTEVYAQSGTGSSGETSYQVRSVSLGGFAGKTVGLRFVYNFRAPGSYFPQTTDGIGWYLDDIEFRNMDRLGEVGEPVVVSGTAFTFQPTIEGSYLLQARARVFGGYPLEWGPSFLVSASGSAPAVLAFAAGSPRVLGNRWILDFRVTAGTAPARFELLRAESVAGNWVPVVGATFETVVAGREYRFTIDRGTSASGFFRIRG